MKIKQLFCKHNRSISEQSVVLFPETLKKTLIIKHCNVCKKIWIEEVPRMCEFITDHYVVWDGGGYSCAICGIEFVSQTKGGKE